MDYENDVIFKYVENLLKGDVDEKFCIDDFSGNHSHTVTKLNGARDISYIITNRKKTPASVPPFMILITCEKDMMSHFEVEKSFLYLLLSDLNAI